MTFWQSIVINGKLFIQDYVLYGFIWFAIVTCLSLVFGTRFYSAVLAPLRWLARQVFATGRIFNDIGTYIVRQRGWSFLQELAYGLEGYGFGLPQAEREPKFAGSAIYKYKDLPEGVTQRALAKRDEWMRRTFGDITKTLSQITAPDLSSLQRKIETDLSLVHAAYYIDDQCIELIADWIAGTARSVEVAGASSDTVRLAS
jgi:hypothetical protein